MILYRIEKYPADEIIEKYKIGNVFNIGEDYNGMFNAYLNRSATILTRTEQKNNREMRYFESLTDYIEKFDLDKATPVQKYHLKTTVLNYIRNSKVDNRENILEDVRSNYYPDRPSRRKCLYLTSKEYIDTWLELLNNPTDYNIYELEVDDNPFQASENLLPTTYLPYEDMYNQSHNYWNPTEEDLKTSDAIEYLYTGKVKVLKRVK